LRKDSPRQTERNKESERDEENKTVLDRRNKIKKEMEKKTDRRNIVVFHFTQNDN